MQNIGIIIIYNVDNRASNIFGEKKLHSKIRTVYNELYTLLFIILCFIQNKFIYFFLPSKLCIYCIRIQNGQIHIYIPMECVCTL